MTRALSRLVVELVWLSSTSCWAGSVWPAPPFHK